MKVHKEILPFQMINSFTAIDFETATANRASVCQVGIVRVVNRKIVERFSILIQPPHNTYLPINTSIHGISAADTKNSPTFNRIWKEIQHLIIDQHVVAHNGYSVDFHCLEQTLHLYKIDRPEYLKHCTYKIFGKKLNVLCAEYGIKLNHHDALSDAEACAELFLISLGGK